MEEARMEKCLAGVKIRSAVFRLKDSLDLRPRLMLHGGGLVVAAMGLSDWLSRRTSK